MPSRLRQARLEVEPPVPTARRDPLPGGHRAGDPPLTAQAFAQWCGFSASAIRRAIRGGELAAINLPSANGRPNYRLRLVDCIAFLRRRGYNPERIRILETLLHRDGDGTVV